MALSCKRLVWAGVVCSWILGSCTTDLPVEYEILHVEGVNWATNVTTSYARYGSTIESEDRLEVFLPVSDGDLLYMVNDQDLELYYRYSEADGNHLVVGHDTLKPHLAFINGSLAQIEVTDETLSGIQASELSASRAGQCITMIFSDSLTDEMVLELKRFESSLRGCGIILDHGTGAGHLNELLSMFRPNWLQVESIPDHPEAVQGMFLEEVELLWTTGVDLAQPGNIHYFKNLESLIISEWEQVPGELVSLSSFEELRTLTLGDCKINDLSHLEIPDHLQRLHLVGCDTLTGIGDIVSMRDLESLGLGGNFVSSLDPIRELTKLKRISFPVNTSQEDFTSITGLYPFLEIVELIDCPGVTDLSPLRDRENLEILILEPDTIWPEHLESLNQLELVILNVDFFENSPDRIAELRAQLPDTRIVPGGGLCMGSGWLLLLLPLIIVSRLFFKKR